MGRDLARRSRGNAAGALVVAAATALAVAGCTSEPGTEGVSATSTRPSSTGEATGSAPDDPATGPAQGPGTDAEPPPAPGSATGGDEAAPPPGAAAPDAPTGGDDAAPPPGAAAGLTAVTPVISFAGARGRTVTVDAIVPDVVEADGSCTALVSVDGISAEAGGPALADANSTTCGDLSVDASGLPGGTASVVVLYLSGSSQGTSAATEVELP